MLPPMNQRILVNAISATWLLRCSLALVYLWFGALKIFATSPAEALVGDLLARTMPFIPLSIFLPLLGWGEIMVGILWLIPAATPIIFWLTLVHMTMTLGPLVLLPQRIWLGFLQPSLEGQYIIKNALIISAAYAVFASKYPLKKEVE